MNLTRKQADLISDYISESKTMKSGQTFFNNHVLYSQTHDILMFSDYISAFIISKVEPIYHDSGKLAVSLNKEPIIAFHKDDIKTAFINSDNTLKDSITINNNTIKNSKNCKNALGQFFLDGYLQNTLKLNKGEKTYGINSSQQIKIFNLVKGFSNTKNTKVKIINSGSNGEIYMQAQLGNDVYGQNSTMYLTWTCCPMIL